MINARRVSLSSKVTEQMKKIISNMQLSQIHFTSNVRHISYASVLIYGPEIIGIGRPNKNIKNMKRKKMIGIEQWINAPFYTV